ncbi:hypothetical protein BDP67DRAFT_492221 [Colletotrichum lupini]|nr:hypothetical protein BDP67DRAFT_492221 [Colletotrichum lupini]
MGRVPRGALWGLEGESGRWPRFGSADELVSTGANQQSADAVVRHAPCTLVLRPLHLTLRGLPSRWPTGLDSGQGPHGTASHASTSNGSTLTVTLCHSHTHTRGHKRASRRMLEAGRRTETDQTSPLGSLQACKSTYSPWIDAGAGASTPARRQHLTSRTSHAEETLKNTLGK